MAMTSSGSSIDPLEHHRHDGERGRAVVGDRGERVLRVEAPAHDERRAERQRQQEVRHPPRVEHRRGDHRRSRARSGIADEQRGDRRQRVGLLALGALRRPGRAAREDHRRGRARPAGRARPSACSPSIRSSSVGAHRPGRAGRRPRDEALAALRRVGDERRELLVVDDRDRLLALAHVGDLRRREHRVEVERVAAELRRPRPRCRRTSGGCAPGSRRRRPGPTPCSRSARASAVRALVDLAEGQRAALVDERDGVRPADRAGRW